jgi:branched-chain amino acid transport system substrate-binding protein
MVKSLEGWSFNGVKGAEQVRAQDHALLQPMFEAQLTGSGATAKPKLLKSLPMSAVAPPLKKMAG